MGFCTRCGNHLSDRDNFCNKCGTQVNAVRKNPNAWYILPILLGFIGGIIMHYFLENEDPLTAKDGLRLGFIVSGICIIIALVVFGIIPYYIRA